MPALSPKEVTELYRKRAKNYDLASKLYYLIGARVDHYRKLTIDSLELKKGDTVVELGCGTGLNFSFLQQKIGDEGRIIGVDITDKMLEKAEERIKKNNWKNVELVNIDFAEYRFPKNIDAVFSTGALSLSSEYDKVVRNCSESLKIGGRFAVFDFKMPNGFTKYLTPVLIPLTKPYGLTKEIIQQRQIWKSVEKYFQESTLKEMYLGYIYISVGVKK